MNSKIWLSPPHMSGEEQKYISEAFEQNWIAPLGSNVDDFEGDLERYLGEEVKVAAVSSGTSALHLAMRMLGVGVGDEVICQSFTFVASANPIVYQGATPIFVDSEPQTWNICPNALEEAIKSRIAKGKKPKAIVIVHLYGMPAKMNEITTIAQKYQIPIVEDAAEALGSEYKGQRCGTFGDLAVLSFNGNKIITTSGGGALVCREDIQKRRAIHLATQARENASHYQHTEVGYNYRMSNILAGIGRGQMEVLAERVKQRRVNHEFYHHLLKEREGISLLVEPNEDFYSNHWLSVVVMDREKTGFGREDLRLRFLAQNIETRPVWKPLHLQPVFKDCPYYGGDIAEGIFERGLCLPSGSNLSREDLQRIAEILTLKKH